MRQTTSYILEIIRYLLKTFRKDFNEIDLYKVLKSDPSFPSLVSICHTLNYFGIEAQAYKSDKTDIERLKGVIIHTDNHDGHFFVVVEVLRNCVKLFDGKNYVLSIEQFLKIWDGVVLMVYNEKSEKTESYPTQTHSLDKKHACINILFLTLIIISLFEVSLFNVISIILDIAGILLCGLLLKRNLGFPQSDTFCQIGKRFDCEYVSLRQPFATSLPFSFEELGLFYFLWDLLSLFFSCGGIITFVVSFLAIFISVFLMLYQIVVIRKYCLYCISLYVIIVIKTSLYYYLLKADVWSLYSGTLLMNELAFLVALALSFAYIELTTTKVKVLEEETENLKIKREPSVLQVLTNVSSFIDMENIIGLKYGVEKAPFQIAIFVSLNCRYCRQILKEVAFLLKRFPKIFNCNVIIAPPLRSNISPYGRNLEASVIDRYIKGDHDLSLLIGKPRDIKTEDPSQASVNLLGLMGKEVENFCVSKFPYVIVNNRILPKYYKISDFQYIYSGM